MAPDPAALQLDREALEGHDEREVYTLADGMVSA